ncbi:SKU5 similar 3 [Artemisia annua]|uniref:SKU5 similar 3 n=1 Tax=Artemisia annua TaxID=35608 RepID=A0A2U1LIP8_ARTAN|nr:SKU5 similar 3 [Artemisia annua]
MASKAGSGMDLEVEAFKAEIEICRRGEEGSSRARDFVSRKNIENGVDHGSPDGILFNGLGPNRYDSTIVPDGIPYQVINVESGKDYFLGKRISHGNEAVKMLNGFEAVVKSEQGGMQELSVPKI